MSQLEKQLDRDVKRQREASEKSLPGWARTAEVKPEKVGKEKKKKKKAKK